MESRLYPGRKRVFQQPARRAEIRAPETDMTDDEPEFKSIASTHYDELYFSWQNNDAEIGALVTRGMFIEFIGPEHRRILDFGCGGGWLLKSIEADTKIGVEINPAAQEHARSLGIEVYSDISEIPSETIDLILSNHALEHVERPFEIMQGMKRVLRKGGTLIIIVPSDRANYPFRENDRDFHLYSWSANNFGNLAKAVGFSIVSVSELVHRGPPKWCALRRTLGPKAFDLSCRVYGRIRRDRSQVRLIATR